MMKMVDYGNIMIMDPHIIGVNFTLMNLLHSIMAKKTEQLKPFTNS